MHRLILLFFIIAYAYGAEGPKRVLICLGQEENTLHKNKHTDTFFPPYYRLNRLLVNEISGLGDLKIKAPYVARICHGHRPVSEAFLRELLLVGKDLFQVDRSIVEEERPFILGAVEELTEKAPFLFFQYISDLQSQASTPGCLFEKIPHLKYFHDQFHYLEVELTAEKIVMEKGKLRELFKGLDRLPQVFKACTKSLGEKPKEHQKADSTTTKKSGSRN